VNIRYKILLGLALAGGSLLFLVKNQSDRLTESENEKIFEEHRARLQQEFLMIRDPRANKIPEKIFEREQAFAQTLPKREKSIFYKGDRLNNVQSLEWTDRGPTNIGGRTRALALDIVNPSTIIAGGVSGGIWKSTDDGATWTMKISPASLHSVTCLVQDTRSGNTSTWYAGSGELIGNSAAEYFAPFRGDGIFKSTDNGESWNLLASTSTNLPQTFDKLFDYVWNVAVDVSRTDSSIVYAATYGAIYRSNDGGTSWNAVLGGATPYSIYTEVVVSSSGTVYAALSSESTSKGLWKSSNGLTWINITPSGFAATYYRTVIGIAPSNTNVVYFLANTRSTGKAGDPGYTDGSDYHMVWKYNSLTGVWTNRSSNLPTWSSPVGGYSSQGSYDMMIRVKPNDTNFVVFGGTNLFRTTDGFATTIGLTSTHWIGGYSTANNVSVYANHHPDQHSGMFHPNNNSIFYCGDDGGVQSTNDVTASTVAWTSLNNGYNVTQFYSVSLDPESNSNIILGGAQDNGTNLGSSSGASAWTQVETGDGTIVKVAPLADNILYTAYQLGGLRRRTRAGVIIPQSPTVYDIQPSNSTNQLFVNPVVLDPNNSSTMYYPAGKSSGSGKTTSAIWRTTNVKNTTVSWTSLTATDIGSRSGYTPAISALAVSNSNSANVLYYGSSDGVVKKLTNAHTATTSTTPVTITPTTSNTSPSTELNAGTSTGGYVTCIAIDPTNSEKIVLTFSNYNFPSLWYSTNGGTTWTDVEGNLSGASGPSVRWATIFYAGETQYVFLGTSTGVYSTTLLNGSSTVWTQEAATEIGNVVVTMLDYRSADNILAVGTHGRGVFTTQIPVGLPVELTTFVGKQKGNAVELIWKTATEQNSYGFELERSTDNRQWLRIGFVEGAGNTSAPRDYSFTDKDISSLTGKKMFYRLVMVDHDGKRKLSNVLEIDLTQIPSTFALYQNYPNPFNPTTVIKYQLSKTGHSSLKVFDGIGREVATLVDGVQDAGEYTVTFNASLLSNGTYFYRLRSGTKQITRKMMLMR
jgi:hypothetical protein